MLRRRLLLWSGLVIAGFVFMHFANHALGLMSLQTLEAGRRIFAFIWRNPLGLTLFYGAVLVHFAVALWSLYRRSNLRLKGWERRYAPPASPTPRYAASWPSRRCCRPPLRRRRRAGPAAYRGRSGRRYLCSSICAVPGMVQPQIVRAGHPRFIGKRRAKA